MRLQKFQCGRALACDHARIVERMHDFGIDAPQHVGEILLRLRSERTLLVLGSILVAAGLLILLFLERVPLPLRLLLGATDLIAGAVLLLVVRQKFSDLPPSRG